MDRVWIGFGSVDVGVLSLDADDVAGSFVDRPPLAKEGNDAVAVWPRLFAVLLQDFVDAVALRGDESITARLEIDRDCILNCLNWHERQTKPKLRWATPAIGASMRSELSLIEVIKEQQQ